MSEENGNCQIFICHLPKRIRKDELEYEFKQFGQIKDIEIKTRYAFIIFENSKSAKEAISKMDGNKLFGNKIVVQSAYRGEKKKEKYNSEESSYSHKYNNRNKYDDDVCFNCGKSGHWAKECPEKKRYINKRCYSCNEKGHLERDCPKRKSIYNNYFNKKHKRYSKERKYSDSSYFSNSYSSSYYSRRRRSRSRSYSRSSSYSSRSYSSSYSSSSSDSYSSRSSNSSRKYNKKKSKKNNKSKDKKNEVINNLSTSNLVNNISNTGINLSTCNINPIIQNFMNNLNQMQLQKNLIENNNNINISNGQNFNSLNFTKSNQNQNLSFPQPINQ